MIEFCMTNHLLIGNTWFPHKKIHKITFESRNRYASSTIDYFTYSKLMRPMVKDVRVYRSAELNTEHRLIIMKTRINIQTKERHKKYTKIDFNKLQNEAIREKYTNTLEILIINQNEGKVKDLNEKWNFLKNQI